MGGEKTWRSVDPERSREIRIKILVNALNRAEGGYLSRRHLMKISTYPLPEHEPICAYVSFANDVILADQLLRAYGKRIDRRPRFEDYRVVDI